MLKRVAALVPNILGTSPGQRVRIESWARHLEPHGWQVDFYPFEDEALHEVLYSPASVFTKANRLARCFRRQFDLVLKGPPCDLLLIYREVALIGPAVLERLAARLGVPIVYDIDDPVFLPYRSPANGWFSLLKFSRKTHTLFKLSDRIIAINNLIGNYAATFNPAVAIVPNCLDTDLYRPAPMREPGAVRIGWTGSQSTMQNLLSIIAPIKRLQSHYTAPLRVIGVGEAGLGNLDVEVKQWSAAGEIADLQGCDIGLVPLADLPWNRWKFFLKTVQYMACGLPVVARRMGSNSEVIKDGVNGFLVETEDEWYRRLELLVSNHDLRLRMSHEARKTAVEQFSLERQIPKIAEILNDVRRRASLQ
ncbi:MAG TPA: glycosyltransferase [Blastocatellia bacterium]|nr:glycosyltransferase [Blastocatellia bacterium]